MIHGDETVYGTDYETDSGLSSERLPSPELPFQVQGLATGIYKEFERMIAQYDENVVKDLMPLVVTILENLDQSMTNCSEYAVEMELLKDDKEQLKTQFERERQLRRLAEQRQMESEDAVEVATRELRQRAESLEYTTRQLELRCKNHVDQVERLQDRESELKTEYNELHQRHTEMIQSYVEHIEKTKALQQQPAAEVVSSPKPNFYGSWYRKEVPRVLDSTSPVTPGSPSSASTPFTKQPTPQTPNSHVRGLMMTPDVERSHTSIQDEMPHTPTAKGGTEVANGNAATETDQANENVKDAALTTGAETTTPKKGSDHNVPTVTVVARGGESSESRVLTGTSEHFVESPEETVANLPRGNLLNHVTEKTENVEEIVSRTENRNTMAAASTRPEVLSATTLKPALERQIGEGIDPATKQEILPTPRDDGLEAGDWVASEVKEMLKLGPDISPDMMKVADAGNDGDRQPDMDGNCDNICIENEAFEHDVNVNKDSLFAEMSRNDLQDVDCGADILGVGKEVENLIHENTKLLATKNALNVVKDDLIHQVDQLTTQLSMLQDELEKSQQAKETLHSRVAALETDLSRMRKQMSEMESNAANPVAKGSEEDESIPMSQRKRFTRVEMARVLMERNQYKERLMELQEAVRWTEMLRASRDHPDLNPQKNKNKSSIFQFFSRLFTSGNSSNTASTSPKSASPNNSRRRSGTASVDMNIGYSVPNSKVIPKSRSGTVAMYGRSPTIEAMQDSAALLKSEAKRGPPEPNDTNRMQACGWSLPGVNTAQVEKSRTVPVPVYCIPLIDANANAKLWCAAAVNIAIGKTRDGGSIVGTGSVFYAQSPDASQRTANTSRSSVDQLDEEIETQRRQIEKEACKRGALSSLVWLVSSDFRAGQGLSGGTKVRVIDARDPSRCLETFAVGSADANILCITSVPGIQEEDYSNMDENNLTTGTESPTKAPDKLPQSTSMPEEVAMEATEDTENSSSNSQSLTVTEHVFTDPLGIRAKVSSTVEIPQSDPSNGVRKLADSLGSPKNYAAVGSPAYGTLQAVRSPSLEDPTAMIEGEAKPNLETSDVEMGFTRVDAEPGDGRLASLQPTMWLGSQNGCVFVHSAMSNWSRCLHQIRLKDSVLAIVHVKGRALAALADGTIAIFRRNNEGVWDLSNYHLLDLGRPLHSIRCMTVVYDKVWCGYRNKIRIIDPKSMQIETSFNAHPRRESQVRGLAWAGDGVWVSIRLDSTLRLYHARTLQHLQDVDVEPYVSKVLGTGKLGFSFVRITALISANSRLWIGTGNGVVISVPLSESAKSVVGAHIPSSASNVSVARSEHGPGGVVRVYSDPVSERVTPGTYIPYCSMANAQLSFHGHRDAVKFFVSVPGCVTQSKGNVDAEEKNPCPSAFSIAEHGANASSLIMSGGEGYIDFRLCDGGVSPQQESALQARSTPDMSTVGVRTQNQSHLIVWQLTPPK